MQRIIMCLLIIVFFFFQNHRAISKIPKEDKAISIEVLDVTSQKIIQQSYVTFETIQNFTVDSVFTPIKNKNTTRKWFGANLCKLLLKVSDVSCEQIHKLSISAPDGYTSVISGELLSSISTAICAYEAKNTEEWNDGYGYTRLIFPELRTMYWVNSPDRIVITVSETKDFPHHFQFNFIDTEKFSKLIKSDLKGNPYIVVDDILVELNDPHASFNILSTDGLYREYPKHAINRYLVLQKDKSETWNVNGINVPQGLKTKNIFFLSSNKKGIFLKPLDNDELATWENLFWQPIFNKISDKENLAFEFALNNGNTIRSTLNVKNISAQFSMYKFLEAEKRRYGNINHITINW